VAVLGQRVLEVAVVGGVTHRREEPAVEDDAADLVVPLVLVARAAGDLDEDDVGHRRGAYAGAACASSSSGGPCSSSSSHWISWIPSRGPAWTLHSNAFPLARARHSHTAPPTSRLMHSTSGCSTPCSSSSAWATSSTGKPALSHSMRSIEQPP